LRIRSYLRIFLTSFIAMMMANTLAQASPPVVMKVLVLSGSTSETSYKSIVTYLGEIGVPYQALALKTITPDSSGNRLSQVSFVDTARGMGLYQAIILTDSSFSACTPSCLSTTDWTTLNNYATQYAVRVASYFTHPAAQWGLLPADSGVSYTAASPLSVTLTTAGSAVFPYLNAANPIPVAGQGTTGITAYRATPTAAANETTTPLMMAGTYTVAAAHTTAAGEEILALTMDNSPSLLHSQAFGYGVINWATKGIFLGSRKVYLNPQIDDLLLGNWIYAPSLHPACESGNTCPTYYQTGPDLQAQATWQAGHQADPLFQSFRGTFGVNGVGTTWFAANDPVFAAIKATSSKFWWISHTWDHPNLDCYSVTNNGVCSPATLSQSLSELNRNTAVAPSLGITLDQIGMVTPFNSGLSNASFLQAAAQVGIKYIVDPAYPASPNIGIVSSLVPSITFLTRMNNNLFDDAFSPSTGVYGSWPDEYNANYGPHGSTPLYSQNQTYSQILDNESQQFLLNNMLAYSPYLLAFHIANSATYDGTHSLYTDLLDATITKYEKIFTLPVLTMNMENIAASMAERASYNASGVSGVYTPGVSVVLTTTKAATIPTTGICSQSACGTYGGQIQDDVVMAANSTVTMPLTSNEGVSLSSLSVSPSSVTGGTAVTGTVGLSGAAPVGGTSVALSSNNAAVTVSASVTVPAGSTTATFNISTSAVTSSVSATVSGTLSGVTKSGSLTVTPAVSVTLSSVSVNPATVTGGTSSTGTVTLSAAAPSGGLSVTLSSSSTSAIVPASVAFAAGSTSATFTITTQSVTSSTSVTITANYSSVSKTSSLTIAPAASVALSSLTLNPTSVVSFGSSEGTIELTAPAPTGGLSVSLASNNAAATPPASVTIAAGSTTATFAIATKSVAYTTSVTLTATYTNVSKTAALTVTPAASVALASVSVSPTSVTTGSTSAGTVTLSAAAPTGGIVVELWTTGAIAYVPDSVTIAAGSTSGSFTITTNYTTASTNDTVTAFYNGTSKTASITVTP
jgi:hypothetical protein